MNNIPKLSKRLNAWKQMLASKVADTAQEYFVDCFKNEAFDGKDWKQVKRRLNAKTKGAKKTNPILYDTGALRNSIKIISAKWSQIKISTEANAAVSEYGYVHNEGTDKIPQRQFMGDAKELDAKIDKIIEDAIDNLFN